jgi:hypothetical protein
VIDRVGTKDRVPDVFIVGAAKSGTTSLYHWLGGHPDVYMSPIKEPNFFAPDLTPPGGTHTLRYPDDLDQYLQLFAGAGDAARAGEASPRYLYSQLAPSLIAELQPAARIVVALRNPIEMAFSLYLHQRAKGAEDLPTFAQAVEAEPDRHAGRRIPRGANPRLATYLDRARYAEQLPRWLDAFGRAHVHVIVFEEMVADPAQAFRRLLEFLEVDPDYRPDEFRAYNPVHAGRAAGLRRAVGRRGLERLSYGLSAVLGKDRTRILTSKVRRSGVLHKAIERPTMDPVLRSRLQEEFMPDVARLSAILGRNLAPLWFGGPLKMAAG